MADFYGKMKAERLGLIPKYRVLSANLVKPTDKERAVAVTSTVQSGIDAARLAGHDEFSYIIFDNNRRIGLLKYRGIETTLFFKRDVTELEPGPADPIPENTITDPADAWIRVDLLNTTDVDRQKGVSTSTRQLLDQVSRLQSLWQGEKSARIKAEDELKKWDRKEEELKALRTSHGLLAKAKELFEKEIELLKRQLREAKEERIDDKIKIVRELFPVFNTVWLAGQHRVQDQLYGMVKKLLLEALGKIGISLVTPEVGQVFDPNTQQAVHAMEFESGAPEVGSVVTVHRYGWALSNGQVQEAASVTVGIEKKAQ